MGFKRKTPRVIGTSGFSACWETAFSGYAASIFRSGCDHSITGEGGSLGTSDGSDSGHGRGSKCVCSYFGLLLRPGNPNPTAFTLPSCPCPLPRAVETSTTPSDTTCHRMQDFTLRGATPGIWWSWRESNPRPARTHLHICCGFRRSYSHVHCGPSKAQGDRLMVVGSHMAVFQQSASLGEKRTRRQPALPTTIIEAGW